jgi:hypothetical protein
MEILHIVKHLPSNLLTATLLNRSSRQCNSPPAREYIQLLHPRASQHSLLNRAEILSQKYEITRVRPKASSQPLKRPRMATLPSNKIPAGLNLTILHSNLVILLSNLVILRSNLVILHSNPDILRSNPDILRSSPDIHHSSLDIPHSSLDIRRNSLVTSNSPAIPHSNKSNSPVTPNSFNSKSQARPWVHHKKAPAVVL